MAILKRIACLALVTALLLSPRLAATQNLHLHEREIKAGMLYSFLKYTEWPQQKMEGPSIVVCLFGGDPFGGYLDNTKGRTVQQRAIVIRSVSSASETSACNLVYVTASQESRWPELSAALAGKGTLTVGDFSGFTASGGMIEFTRKGDRIAVVMNIDAVRSAKLSVQDRLLRLVTVVHGKGGP